MANHISALKRARQAKRHQASNRRAVSTIKTAVKKVRLALSEKNADSAKVALKEAVTLMDRAASKKVWHKKRASRRASRLTVQVNLLPS